MDKYRDELKSLDQELNRYQRKIEKINNITSLIYPISLWLIVVLISFATVTSL